MNRNMCFLIIRNQKLDAKEKKIVCLFKLSTTYLESSSNESFPWMLIFFFSPLRVSSLPGKEYRDASFEVGRFLKREGARCIVFKRGVEDGWKEEFRRIGCSLFSCFRSFPSDRNSSWLIRCLLSVFPVCGGGTKKLNEESIFLRLPITLHFFWDVLAARIADSLKILFNLILENYKYYRNEHNSNKLWNKLNWNRIKKSPLFLFPFLSKKNFKNFIFFSVL